MRINVKVAKNVNFVIDLINFIHVSFSTSKKLD